MTTIVNPVAIWRTVELAFESDRDVVDPYRDVDAEAVFAGPGGIQIRRPAFWDGGRTWRVRFAPTRPGPWRFSARSNDASDTGLNGVTGDLLCVDDDDHGAAVHRQGFLRQDPQGHHLEHIDGTPFFWLGDTHWRFAYESWDTANKPGWTSQFRGMVDRRVDQGFTVYQSNLLMVDWFTGRSPYWIDGESFGALDVRFLQTVVDPRMAYIADSGLVNALGLGWHQLIDAGVEHVKRFARYIVARYGSYPMVWTLGGEVAGYDPDVRQTRIDGWREVALAIRDADGYSHPLTAHATTERPIAPHYQGEEWLTLTLNQHGHGDFDLSSDHYRDHLAAHPGTPLVEGESMYEGLISVEYAARRTVTDTMVRQVAYRAIQAGCCGYTYGAQGCWNAAWDRDHGATMWGDLPWYEGIDLPGADQLGHFRRFYEAIAWHRLRPAPQCFHSDDVFNTAIYPPAVTADPERRTIVMFFAETYRNDSAGAWVEGLADVPYDVRWFDPRSGVFTDAARAIQPDEARIALPSKPDGQDWVLLVRSAEE